MWYFTGLDFIIRYFLGRLDVNFGLGPQSGIGIENFDLRFQNRSALDNYVVSLVHTFYILHRAKSTIPNFKVLYRTGFHNKILPWTPGHFDLRFQNRSALDNYVVSLVHTFYILHRAKSTIPNFK
ncbi:unnamed protein product [Rhizophagus irregularis]|nr:unnamed protein product [Rhizophagus irregularis]